MLELFEFIRADVSSHQAKGLSDATNAISEPNPASAADPAYPKSLFLIQPLHSRPLHPAALSAAVGSSSSSDVRRSNINVPIPEGLDLESWIAPPPRPAARHGDEGENVAPSSGTGPGERKKGKQKASAGDTTIRKKKKQAKEATSGGAITLSRETEEERAARARVSRSSFRGSSLLDSPVLLVLAEGGASRGTAGRPVLSRG